MKSKQMLADLKECVEIFDTLCDTVVKLSATEQRIMRLALRETARYAARFCAATHQLKEVGLEAAFELLDAELYDFDDDGPGAFQSNELN